MGIPTRDIEGVSPPDWGQSGAKQATKGICRCPACTVTKHQHHWEGRVDIQAQLAKSMTIRGGGGGG